MNQIIKIAVDGPSGAGKSTIAKAVAAKLNIDYIDTGSMYRAVGYKLLQEGIDLADLDAVQELLNRTDIDFDAGKTILDGRVMGQEIRTPEISKQASACSALAIVRKKLVELQQKMGESKSVIMDGRDIATVVFPDADYKFYVTASAEERAKRRYHELVEKGQQVEFQQVLQDIIDRDHADMTREVTPLRKADDAVEVDTTHMTIEEVTDYICKEMK